MKIALLTCATWPGIEEQERAIAKEFSSPIQADVVVWNDPEIIFSDYQFLIFRTTWDYFEKPELFSDWLEKIVRLGIQTINPISAIRRNQHKFYLKDLQELGVEIIPTIFVEKNCGMDLSRLLPDSWQKLVIKPAVSGGAYLTRLFDRSEIASVEAQYTPIAVERDLLIQPFMPEIQQPGELSLLFFGGEFSHAVLKRPSAGEFRVQSQFGGNYRALEVSPELIATAAKIIAAFGCELAYARVDGIIVDGKFLLMELELIEPDLYFDYDLGAKKRYLAALELALAKL
jgi:glutathione synthase/RimK-type ligase-like ATP-grasp enzyme